MREQHVSGAVVAALALLAAGCGGGSPAAGASSQSGSRVQKLDAFAACMRGHGVLNFYLSPKSSTPSPSEGIVLTILGYQVTGVDPRTPPFPAAMAACRHILGIHPQSPAVQHAQFVQALKSAACMRSHGYPDWPDPSTGPDGQGLMIPGPPPGVDVSSPQLQAAAKACGEPLP